MTKLFFIWIALIALGLGYYWMNPPLAAEQSADVLTDDAGTLSVDIEPLKAIAEPGVSTQPRQLIGTDAQPAVTTDNLKVNPASFLPADNYAYQRDDSAAIHVGEFEDADDYAYQRNDSAAIHVGEFEDADDFSY
jgi:hypothetical protein